MSVKHKIKLYNKAYSTNKAILVVDSYVEHDDKGFMRDIIFFEIKFYKDNTKVQMLIDTHTLRGLCYGIEELLYKGETAFKKYSGGSGSKKELSLGRDARSFFINLSESGGAKLQYIFGENGAKSFVDAMRLYAECVDKALFEYQRNSYQGGLQ